MKGSCELQKTSLVVVGNGGIVHVGRHLCNAATALGIPVRLADTSMAREGPWLMAKCNWHLRGHRPNRLNSFSSMVVDLCQQLRPKWIVATGLAPLSESALEQIGDLGIPRLNFLTDDPWNPVHRAPWFMQALRRYDVVFTPRRANIAQLQECISKVIYLPFGYAPEVHYPVPHDAAEEADVVFIGAADTDRVPYFAQFRRTPLRIALYGGYWDRYKDTRPYARGFADAAVVRRVTSQAKVAVCLVRRANRDGHVMRTFEIPAIGGCMLTEDTPEHREILGEEGRATLYFRTPQEMAERVQWLIGHDQERRRLSEECRRLILAGAHSYHDRLSQMLGRAGAQLSASEGCA